MKTDVTHSEILLCDDSISNLLLVSKLLESEGYQFITKVSNPEDVLVELTNKQFDLLLLDIEMPRMDGLEVLRQIHRRQLVNEFFPVIILSGRKDEFTRNKALEIGAIDFINKPFDQTEILLRVKNTLRQYEAYKLKNNLANELEKRIAKRTQQLEASQQLLIQRLAMAGELKDQDTGNHVIRVGQMASH